MSKIKIIESTDELIIEYKTKLVSDDSFVTISLAFLICIIFLYNLTSISLPIFFLLATFTTVFLARLYNTIVKFKIKVKSILISISSQFGSWFFRKILNISTKDLIQIYVKEKQKEDVTLGYELHAKYAKGKATKLFLKKYIIKDLHDAQLIEQKIEKFLGLKDFQIHSEYRGGLKKPLLANTPLSQVKERNPTQLNIKDLEIGAFLDYELVTWEVVYQTQYDWDRKITEIQYQLSDHKSKSMLLFVQTHEKYPSIWLEEKLTYHDLEIYKLRDILYSPPTELTFKDLLLFRKNVGIGKKFIPNEQEGLEVRQWHYSTADEKQSLRILQYEGKGWAAFLGEKIEEFEFDNILPS